MRSREGVSPGLPESQQGFAGQVVPYDQLEHASQLVTVLLDMRPFAYPGRLGGSSAAELERWVNAVPMEKRWVALGRAGQVVGHVGLTVANANGVAAGLPRDAWEVVRLFVAPLVRGGGAGRELLGTAVRWAEGSGRSAVLLVSDYLTEAIRFYEAHNWVCVGSKRSAVSGDTLLIYRQGDDLGQLSLPSVE